MGHPPKRKLTVTLGGTILALSALTSGAAGLGKLSVNSALGQPLSAEIELVSLLPGEFEAIKARVASPDAYADGKIEYSPLLRQLNFSVEKRPDGKPILKITSTVAINEPFLDVLVQMNWPAGQLLREYPILLDPPGFNPSTVAQPVATVAPQRLPATPLPSAKPANPITNAVPSARTESASDTYGAVKTGETLSGIAKQIKPNSVSLEQMLVALYRENRAAFINNNMNKLKVGQVLRVPTVADIAKISQAEAQKEIKLQVADWKAYREQVSTNPTASTQSSSASAGSVEKIKPNLPLPAVKTDDQLKIAKSASGNGQSSGVAAKGPTQEQLDSLKEENIAKTKQLEEANTQIALLQKQLSDLRKLQAIKGAEPPKPTQVAEVSKPDSAKPADVAKPPEAKIETPPAKLTAEPVKPVAPTSATQPTPAAKTAVKAVAPPPPQEPGILDILQDNLTLIAGVLIGLLGVGGLFLFLSRKRKKTGKGDKLKFSNPSSIIPEDLKPNTVTGNRAGGLVDTGNSSFLTDFDKTGPGNIDTDDVDPLAEADVYIAYGRDAQAEEILKEAMARDKSRHEIAIKLLEIYHNRKSVQAFETVAKELHDAIGEDHPRWSKVAAMGVAIDPQNPLYGGAKPYDTTGAFISDQPSAESSVAAPPDLDFDLGFTDNTNASSFDVTAPPTDQAAAPASMDFDLDLNAALPAEPAVESSAPDESNALDFDLAFDEKPAQSEVESKPSASAGFDFDLSSLSLDEPAMQSPPAQAEAPPPVTEHEKTIAINLNELSLDIEPAPAASSSLSEGNSAVATKLELAKAYIEIGDSDGAKEILSEVAHEGSPAQQEEAKKILLTL